MGRRASDYTYRLGQIGKIGNKGKPDMGRGWKVIKATIAAAGVVTAS